MTHPAEGIHSSQSQASKRTLTLAGADACPFCEGRQIQVKYQVGAHRIMRCAACTFMWLHPRPNLDDLHSVYDESYFKNENFFEGTSQLYGYHDYFEERFRKQIAYREMLAKVKGYLGSFEPGKSRFLDVGCGVGYLMDVAQDEGFQVSGVEFNGSAVEQLRSKYVFPAVVGDVLDYNEGPFDVITLMDVIEHFMDPLQSVDHISQLMKPGGIFILSTMDCDGIVSKVLGTRIEDFRRVREHLFFFTRRSVTELLEKCGFEVIQIKYHGHSFRLGFLAERLKMVFAPIGWLMAVIVKGLGMDQLTVRFNPLTKMIVYARRKP